MFCKFALLSPLGSPVLKREIKIGMTRTFEVERETAGFWEKCDDTGSQLKHRERRATRIDISSLVKHITGNTCRINDNKSASWNLQGHDIA